MINLSLKNENISSSMEVNEKNICIKTFSGFMCVRIVDLRCIFS